MSNFKTIEKLGLKVHNVSGLTVVSADSLEVLLQSAQVVYGGETNSGLMGWNEQPSKSDTDKALLLCVEPLKKKTKAEAALELLQEMVDDKNCDMDGTEHNFFIEAQRILEMKDEV